MRSDTPISTDALDGNVLTTFARYLIPSLLGLVAMTSASLVDGIFIGNYVGVTALAAVNLIIPILSLLFGVGMMVSIGGSVRCGKYLGEKDGDAASAIFSKTLMFMAAYGVAVIALGLAFEEIFFAGLGASQEIFPVMSEYYRVVIPFALPQLIVIQMYFFVRLDSFPNLAAVALALGAAGNIILDYFFIAVYGWGLAGAAWATGLSGTLSLLVFSIYFFRPERKLKFNFRQDNWRELLQAAYNGISEFINEVSGAFIAFLFNLMLIQRAGVEGVAAITVVNYILMTGFMVFFAISDSSQVMISQNFGARKSQRIWEFLGAACAMIATLSVCVIIILLTASESLIYLFIDDKDNTATVALALGFIHYVWPLFCFVGFNMLISGYLTAVHLPFQSALVALCRSLILPTVFLTLFYMLLSDFRFVGAIAVAEAITFILAAGIFLRFTPGKVITANQNIDLQR